jgi:hypothetical protein
MTPLRIYTPLILAVLSSTATAQYMRADGDFSSKSLSVRVVLLDGRKGVAAVSAAVNVGECSGNIAGIGEFKSRKLVIEPYKKFPDGEACKLELSFDTEWQRVKATGNHCEAYSGASCGFEGQEAQRINAR